ncbi:hypothetical protein [Gordonia liuliyuniae]|uniref:Uncharacterized protein n=1 Tax=Gordonia liuliyuniae TaxID=2911517 RepID=A0ABS9IQ09_9ACTN|nr:hypothetical protein [Gordonia liuliyuniae]MCF8587632.1 hypothetical protein [Gordonia liuliyuniae]
MNVPNPAELAAQNALRSAEPGDPADHPVTATVHALLEEVAAIGDVGDGEFDLGAVSRQTELLTRAHDALAEALEDVGRG